MHFRPLSIVGACEVTPVQHGDDRGVFLEWFKERPFVAASRSGFDLKQANLSVSGAGVLRGIHYADVPPGQPKYVTCVSGAVLDVVVDLRTGSPTFGAWDSVRLDDVERKAVFIPEGLGHAVMSLRDGSTLVYLCAEPYRPGREHGVHALDPRIGIAWPTTGDDGLPLWPVLSEKDAAAPPLAEAMDRGLLPSIEACLGRRPVGG
jgi:dTDP-4-dehydrorhamnose 3,5-epimerase